MRLNALNWLSVIRIFIRYTDNKFRITNYQPGFWVSLEFS